MIKIKIITNRALTLPYTQLELSDLTKRLQKANIYYWLQPEGFNNYSIQVHSTDYSKAHRILWENDDMRPYLKEQDRYKPNIDMKDFSFS